MCISIHLPFSCLWMGLLKISVYMGRDEVKTEAAQNTSRRVYLGMFCLEQEARRRLKGRSEGQKAEGLI